MFNLDSAVDRLLSMGGYCMGEQVIFLGLHQIAENATHPIAHFSGCRALLLRLAWNGHAASSRLAQQPEKRTLAGRISACTRIPFRRRMACHPKPLLHLGRVQLRNLG